MEDQELVDRVLAIVNAARETCGEEQLERIPRGLRGSAASCPLARALPDDPAVGGMTVWFAEEDAAKALAKELGVEAKKSFQAHGRRAWHVGVYNTPLSDFVWRFDDRQPFFDQFVALVDPEDNPPTS